MRQPYFDTIFIGGGRETKPHKDIYTKETDRPKISPSDVRSTPKLIYHLLEENNSLYRLREENVKLAHHIAEQEIKHSGRVANYFVLGMGTGIAMWEIIKLIVG